MKADASDGEVCAVVAKLIDYGVNINTPYKNCRTALHYAAQHGHVEVVKLLVHKEAKLNTKDQQNQTALIDACQNHHEETISALIEAGADLWVQSSRGTALQVLCLVGCHKCVKLILDRDQIKDPLGKYYTLAARSSLARSLLSRYYMRRFGEGKGAFGTSLHAAAFHDSQEIVELLLEQGKFKIHATHDTYGSVLTAAAAGCNMIMKTEPYERIFEMLIAHGVNVNDRKGTRGPALLAAALNGHKGLVELLLDNGAKAKSALGIKGTGSQATSDIGYEKLIELIDNGGAGIAAASGRNSLENPLSELFDVRQEFLKLTLTATNKGDISSLMSTGETFICNEIGKGEITKKLSMMLTLGNEVFKETAELATNPGSTTKQRKIKKRVKVAENWLAGLLVFVINSLVKMMCRQ
ncbi:ankyrin repeat-containing domain protein [Trichoderma compactum]